MTSSQYYNIICGTLCNMTEDEREDSASVAKKVFDNCGEAFPSGNCAAVLYVLKSNDYVSWRSCTAEEAQQYANQGIPTVAIDENQVTIIRPEEAALLVKNPLYVVVSGSGGLNTVRELCKDEESKAEYFSASYVGRKGDAVYAKVEQSYGTLTTSQQNCNANYIFDYLRNKGFTKEAVCGILGNIQQECGLNPGLWNKLNNIKSAYGLFQWRPADEKYLKWMVESNGVSGSQSQWAEYFNVLAERSPQRLINTQMEYFLYSCEPKSVSGDYCQWSVPADGKNHTKYKWPSFATYRASIEPVRILALVFHDHYEKSNDSDENLKKRQDYAEKWYKYFFDS